MEYDEYENFVQYVTVNIEDIQVGDLVYSYDTATGEVSQKAVTDTFIRECDHLNYLTIIDEQGCEQVIETTDGHPFWVVTDDPDLSRVANDFSDGLYHGKLEITEYGYWVEAKDLRVGDVFLGANGELSVLVDSVRVEFDGNITVYNFSVDANHNYFIIARDDEYGQSCVLVHNAGNFYDNPLINRQQQDGHVLGTRQYLNRVKQEAVSRTSAFPDRVTAEAAVTEARQLGKQVPNRPNVLEHDLGKNIGFDRNGNPTSVVRVHLKPSGVYHGYPY